MCAHVGNYILSGEAEKKPSLQIRRLWVEIQSNITFFFLSAVLVRHFV